MSATSTRWVLAAAGVLAVAGAAYLMLGYGRQAALPPGIATGNGRLEATEVDVAAKVAGRLLNVAVQEGDEVTAGQVLAELDAEDLKAQLRAAEAQVVQAQKGVDESRSAARKSRNDVVLADKTLHRSEELVGRGFISRDKLDRDQIGMESAMAGMAQATSHVAEADAGVVANRAKVDSLHATLRDMTLKAPIDGRVLYRLAQPGEVVAAGGKVLTLLYMTDVYLSIYLPTEEAGKLAVGSPARIVLDALKEPIPARVAFVAPRSQFTPKEVETRNEREKLMFRVKLRAESDWLAAHANLAKPGMPGVGYVLTDPGTAWPESLAVR